jgi:hypothetical protein
MPLPLKFKRYTFAICFGISFFPFVAFNLLIYFLAVHFCKGDTVMEGGFPLKWYVCGWVGPGVIWDALFFDLMLAIAVSFISAKILKPILEPVE